MPYQSKRKGGEVEVEQEIESHDHHKKKRRKIEENIERTEKGEDKLGCDNSEKSDARACDKTTEGNVTQKEKEGLLQSISIVKNINNECEISPENSSEKNLLILSQNDQNEESLSKNAQQIKPKREDIPAKNFYPIFTATFKPQGKPKYKANQTSSSTQRHHPHKPSSKGIKKNFVAKPKIGPVNCKSIEHYFKTEVQLPTPHPPFPQLDTKKSESELPTKQADFET